MSNHVTLVGNATSEPTLRFTPSGAAVANFGLAVNRRWRNKQTNEWEEQTSFFDVVCWRELAENVTESIVKGARVIVTGRLDQRTWQTQDGENRSKIEVVADDVGPSLRWATAQVTRNERHDSTNGGYTAEPAAPAYAPDEAPFRVDAGTWDPAIGFGELPTRMLPK